MTDKLSGPTNLNALLKGAKSGSTLPSATYTPNSAVKFIESERSKREYAQLSALTLLGMEDEYASKLIWLKSQGKSSNSTDKKVLEAVRRELSHGSRVDLAEARVEFARRNKWLSLYPDEGPLRRELYPKHLEFFGNSAKSNEVMALGSNRSGKTLMAAYAVTCHVTGIYPAWWPGKRFDVPLHCWAVNKGAKEARDINEQEFLGPSGNIAARGTGMIPGHRIIKCTPKSGTPNAMEFIDVRHVSGGQSRIQSKSFDQGREAFQGTATPLIWLDEECPEDVYGECLMRTMTCEGLILVTYTPILGLTPLTTEFLRAAGIEIEGQPLNPQTQSTQPITQSA